MKHQENAASQVKKKIRFNQTMLLVVLMAVIIIALTINNPLFLSWRNIKNILLQNAVAGIATVGMCILMISGGIDLSIGNQISFYGCLLALLLKNGMNEVLAPMLVLLIATALGALSGLIISNTSAAPFIITLGLMNVYKAAALIVSNGSDIPINKFTFLGRTPVLTIMLPVWIFLILFLIVGYVLRYLQFGRTVYAIGSNVDAAYISGVGVKSMKVWAYTINGLLVGLAAAVLLSRLGSAVPTMGDGYEMTAIAACAIGGITLSGGEGNALGAFLGVLFLGIIRNGLNIIGVESFYQYLVNGIIIIIAVVLSNFSNKNRS